MKNILKLFAAATLGLSLASCSGFLEEKVTTSLATQHLYSTQAALNADILGCYKSLTSAGFLSGPMHEWLQPASGVLHWGGSNSSRVGNALERWTCQLNFTRYSKHPESYTNNFKGFSQAAYIANAFLGALPQSTVDEAIKSKYEGEAYFVRAVAYFYLVRIYGDVSIAKVPPTTVAEVCAPRTNFWEVYNFILEDLTKAFELMPTFDEMVEMAGGNASGRVCNYGAKAMRSLVYLTIGTLLAHPDDNFWVNRTPEFVTPDGQAIDSRKAFELALADAEDVINNGPFELAPSYGQLFRWGGLDTTQEEKLNKTYEKTPEDFQLKERIFVIPRTAEGSGGNLSMWTIPKSYHGTVAASNAGRTRPTRWEFQQWCKMYGGVKGTGANNKNIFIDNGDARMKMSFGYYSYMGADYKAYSVYPHNSYIKGQTLSSGNNYTRLDLYNIKYYDATFDNNVGQSDLYLMRYAEVFLIAAEAAAYLCSDPSDSYGQKAIGYVNKILERARKSGDGAPGSVVVNYEGTGTCAEPKDWTTSSFANPKTAGTTPKDSLLTAIFWERCFELNFECHEYFDTHRCGAKWILDNIVKPKNAFFDLPEQDSNWVQHNYGTGAPYGTTAADGSFRYFEDVDKIRKGLINAYPNDELVSNTELDVNLHDPNRGQNPVEVFWR